MKSDQLMQAVLVGAPGGHEVLKMGKARKPIPGPNEILVKVKATALNRADILQRKGKYPPPEGASDILGLEMAGTVVTKGPKTTRWDEGDSIFGLLPGGGYAEYAVIHEGMAMAKPGNLSFEQAAGIPEVFLTAFQALVWISILKTNEYVLIHAGASGVGTAAIQLAKSIGANILVTASETKHQACIELGASMAIDYKKGPFQPEVEKITQGKGVDVIIDFIGGPYFNQNLNCLKRDGRLVLLAIMGGGKVEELDVRKVLAKRLRIEGSTLRSRSQDYQIRLTSDFKKFALDKFSEGEFKPVIDKVFDWTDVQEAHAYMEANKNTGKIILKING